MLAFFERGAGAVNEGGVIAQLATGGRGALFKAYLRGGDQHRARSGVGLRWCGADHRRALGVRHRLRAQAAWSTTRLPHLAPHHRAAGEPRLAVLRDWPWVAVTIVTGLFSLQFFVLELGLALYVSSCTAAPTVTVAILLVLNTTAVVVFQVGLSRRAYSVEAGAKALVRGAWWIAGGFVILGLADRGFTWLAVGALVLGSLVHVVGEIIGSGGRPWPRGNAAASRRTRAELDRRRPASPWTGQPSRAGRMEVCRPPPFPTATPLLPRVSCPQRPCRISPRLTSGSTCTSRSAA